VFAVADVEATCDPTPVWLFPTPSTIPITQAASDASDAPSANGVSYFAQGSTLRAVWNETAAGHTAGALKWAISPLASGTINPPTTAVLSNGVEYVFYTASDGNLYKTDAETGMTTTFVNLQRPGCVSDQFLAGPSVQVFAKSNATFQNAIIAQLGHAEDLVFVVTQYPDASGSCPDSANKIYALKGSILMVK